MRQFEAKFERASPACQVSLAAVAALGSEAVRSAVAHLEEEPSLAVEAATELGWGFQEAESDHL